MVMTERGRRREEKIIVSRNAYSWGGFLPMKCSSNVEKTECKPVYNVERVFPRCGTRCSSVRHRLPVKLQLYAFQFFRGGGGRTRGGQILDKTTENDGALFCFQFETDYNFNLVLFFFFTYLFRLM